MLLRALPRLWQLVNDLTDNYNLLHLVRVHEVIADLKAIIGRKRWDLMVSIMADIRNSSDLGAVGIRH